MRIKLTELDTRITYAGTDTMVPIRTQVFESREKVIEFLDVSASPKYLAEFLHWFDSGAATPTFIGAGGTDLDLWEVEEPCGKDQ